MAIVFASSEIIIGFVSSGTVCTFPETGCAELHHAYISQFPFYCVYVIYFRTTVMTQSVRGNCLTLLYSWQSVNLIRPYTVLLGIHII